MGYGKTKQVTTTGIGCLDIGLLLKAGINNEWVVGIGIINNQVQLVGCDLRLDAGPGAAIAVAIHLAPGLTA